MKKKYLIIMAVIIVLICTIVFLKFSGVLEASRKQQNAERSDEIEEAMESFEKFLQGEQAAEYDGYEGETTIDIRGITVPTGEPEKHYISKYTYFDSDLDGLPELHVWSARTYIIVKYQNENLRVWKELSRDYELLNNGAFLARRNTGAPVTEGYRYCMLDCQANEIYEIGFSRHDSNDNGIADEEDTCLFDEVEVTAQQWNELKERYLEIGTDKIQWTTIYEETN